MPVPLAVRKLSKGGVGDRFLVSSQDAEILELALHARTDVLDVVVHRNVERTHISTLLLSSTTAISSEELALGVNPAKLGTSCYLRHAISAPAFVADDIASRRYLFSGQVQELEVDIQ